MRKFGCILKKEFIVLFRDLPGLVILFLMPLLLIFVVTLAQENALKGQKVKTDILFVDEVNTSFTKKLLNNFDSSGFFNTILYLQNTPLTAAMARKEISKGNFKFGLVISKSDSGMTMLIDPSLQETYRVSIANSIRYQIKNVQSKEVLADFLLVMPKEMQPIVGSMITDKLRNLPPVKEEFAVKELASITPNVIQNNVPGFILFAMFFIVIPLAGSIITEKTEGSFQRLRSLPVNLLSILGSKVVTYLLICSIQFLLMMATGIWGFPALFGFPPLELGNQYLAIALATIAASLAAVGFGLLVGTLASSHNQAALFGSVMVVLLGIVSGTFLPIHLMPQAIQYLSYLSPIRWGIENYLTIFIREGTIMSIVPYSLLLITFFVFAMTSSIVIFAKRT